jgi:ABC-2 type transport system permease protein
MTDAFYWIFLDLLIWGITGVYFQRFSTDGQQIIFAIISGVILWNIAYRSQIDISMSLLEELWNKNLVNLFVSPLTFAEWITSLTLLGLLKATVTLIFGGTIGFILYKVNLINYSYNLLLFFGLLLMTGWWLGYAISGIILRFGTKVQTLAWTLVWFISPFSAIYYPLNTLPTWVQKISHIIPTSYVFEEARRYLTSGRVDYNNLAISFALNVLYIALALIFLKSSFDKVLKKGLVKVY